MISNNPFTMMKGTNIFQVNKKKDDVPGKSDKAESIHSFKSMNKKDIIHP